MKIIKNNFYLLPWKESKYLPLKVLWNEKTAVIKQLFHLDSIHNEHDDAVFGFQKNLLLIKSIFTLLFFLHFTSFKKKKKKNNNSSEKLLVFRSASSQAVMSCCCREFGIYRWFLLFLINTLNFGPNAS